MPNAPLRACPGCRRRLSGPGPCARCRRQRDAQRGTARDRGYDAGWATYSRAWLARFPWCGQRRDGQLYAEHSRCVRRGARTRAAVTDHIVRLRDGGARLDPANHQSLCRGCNVAKDAPRVPRP
jgi:5-methylcytosine-specific restriction enzyme A